MAAVVTPADSGAVDPEMLTGGAPIVVLAPHPDDESLGCGALLAYAFSHEGAHVICMTDGSASHPGSRQWPPARLAEQRYREVSRAIKCLGGTPDDLSWLGYPDGWLGAQDQDTVVTSVAHICRTRAARHFFAPAREDHHEDHKSTARIARRVAEATAGLTLFSYPVWSRWDNPDLVSRNGGLDPFVLDPGQWRGAKRLAIAAHASQLDLVVHDDPKGFRLDPAFVETFADSPEIFWKDPV